MGSAFVYLTCSTWYCYEVFFRCYNYYYAPAGFGDLFLLNIYLMKSVASAGLPPLDVCCRAGGGLGSFSLFGTGLRLIALFYKLMTIWEPAEVIFLVST